MKGRRPFNLDLSERFPHLSAAPVVEAVIEWRARAGKLLEPAELRRQLALLLPDYPECQPQHELRLEAQLSLDGSSTQTQRDPWQGFRLTARDKLHVLQFTRNGIVFSRLTPYEEWNVFSAQGHRLWQVFVELTEPTEIERLGVRFINRIHLGHIEDVLRYVVRPPECLEPLGLPVGQFLYQSLHDVPGHPFRVNVVQTVQPPPPPQSHGLGLILDIDVGTTQALPCDDRIVLDRLTQMHWLKNKAFFSLLSKEAIALFQEPDP